MGARRVGRAKHAKDHNARTPVREQETWIGVHEKSRAIIVEENGTTVLGGNIE